MFASFGSDLNLLVLDFTGALTIVMLIVLVARQSRQADALESLSQDFQVLLDELFDSCDEAAGSQDGTGDRVSRPAGMPATEALASFGGALPSAMIEPQDGGAQGRASRPVPPLGVALGVATATTESAAFSPGSTSAMPAAAGFTPASAPAVAPAGFARGAASITASSMESEPPSQVADGKPRFRMENWIGRNAIGVLASVLVFLGLVFLGATFVPQLSDQVKVALMFVLSGALTVGGGALAVVRKNGFTSALMGCGVGSLFISIFVTHIYFGMLGEVASYALILAWMVLCLALVRKTESLLLAVVLQIGLAISVCLGYSAPMDEGRLVLLLGYQLAASVIVVGGNMLFYRRMYRSSLVLAIVLSIVASSFLWACVGAPQRVGLPLYGWGFCSWNEQATQPIGLIVAACALQLATSAALAILLVKSLCEASSDRAERESERAGRFFIALALLWLAVLRINVFAAIEYCVSWALRTAPSSGLTANHCEYYAAVIAAVAFFVLAVASLGVFLAYVRKQGLSVDGSALRGAVIAYLVGGAFVAAAPTLLGIFMRSVLRFTTLWMWAAVSFAIGCKARGREYHVMALAFVAFDALFYCLFGFKSMGGVLGELGAIALGGVVVIGLCGFAGAILHALKTTASGVVGLAVASTLLVMSYLYFCTPLVAEGYRWSLCCMICALTCIVLGFRMRIGGLRLYGLVLVIACVAKLALLDIAALDSLARVGAFIAGGVICFAISALYNFAVKRFAVDEG